MTLGSRVEINLRKYWPAISLIGLFSVVIAPAVFTPLVADDFIISIYSNYVIKDDSWWDVTYGAIAQSIGGTHFTVLNALISGYWLKIWLSVYQELHLNLHFGFWFAKVVVYTTWFIALRYFVYNVLQFKGSRFKIDFTLILSFATILQIHTLWSNDPVTNYVFAGFLPVTFALITLSKFFEYSKNPTLRNMVKVSALSLVSLLFYEINFAVVPVFLLVALLTRHSEEKSNYKLTLLRLIPAGFTTIAFIFLRTYTGQNATAYNGTTILFNFDSIKTFIINVCGALPTSTWFLASKLDKLYVSLPLFVSISLILFYLNYFHRKSERKQVIKKAPIKQVDNNCVILLSITVWGLGAVAIQSLTPKIQIEVNEIGKIYTSYATSATVTTILFTAFMLRRIKPKTDVKYGFILFLAAAQITLNFGLNLKLWEVMSPNVRLISVATAPTDLNRRCAALNNWLNVGFPPYYTAGTVRGLNVYSKAVNNELFCESLTEK